MELRHLRYFTQVAEDLHFARAAHHLGISQPPLSQQIRALEEELGVRLFERTSRSVALTPAGRLFLEEARATLAQANHAIMIARRAARGELGELAIGVGASAAFIPSIAAAIHRFRSSYPDVRMTMVQQGGPELLESVIDRVIDVAFLRRSRQPDVPDTVVAVPLLTERLMVVMRPDHPFADRDALALGDLEGEPLLLYAEHRSGGFTRELLGMLRDAGVTPTIAQTANEVATLFGLAAAGLGVTVMAESLCALRFGDLTFRPLLDPQATTGMWLVHVSSGITLPCEHFLSILGDVS